MRPFALLNAKICRFEYFFAGNVKFVLEQTKHSTVLKYCSFQSVFERDETSHLKHQTCIVVYDQNRLSSRRK